MTTASADAPALPRGLKSWVLPTLIYVVATLAATWPLPRMATEGVLAEQRIEDTILVAWILSWDLHALVHQPRDLFHGNLLYPTSHVVARSELLLGALPVFAPVMALTGNPLLALNVVILVSFISGGLLMHLLIRRWGGHEVAAYVAGLAVAPWRLRYLHWPHLLSVQYLPLVLLLLDQAARDRRWRIGLLAGCVITLQVLCSFYLGYMTLIVVAAYLLSWGDLEERGPGVNFPDGLGGEDWLYEVVVPVGADCPLELGDTRLNHR